MERAERRQQRYVSFLSEDSGEVENPDDRGVWQHINQLINKLSKGLKIPKEASADALTAIPTVWARPILFAQALTNKKHPLYKEILGEWRGLLGLFCFRESFGWNISSSAYSIRENSQEQFEKTLYTLIPHTDWRRIHLIYIKETLIGATSPLSLFFTPVEYKCPNSIPWKKNGRLDDPTEYLSSYNLETELYILKKWIDKTRKEIAKSGLDKDTKFDLKGVLDDWFDEVAEKITPGLPKLKVTFGRSIIDDNPYKIATRSSSYKKPQKSDFFLECKIEDTPPIVIVKELWEKGGLVYPPLKASNIPFGRIPNRLEGEAKEISDAIEYNGKYLRPELLFTDKILKLSLFEDNVVTNHNEYVFPLRKEILHFFEPEEIKELVEWEDKGESGVKVTLRLPLGTVPKSYAEVSKFYRADKIIEPELVPTLDVWPNFRADDWQHYYGLYLKYKQAPFSCEFYPKPEKAIEHPNTWLWRMKEFPKAVICNDLKENPIGLIPVKQLEELDIVEASKWFVAVDFGTSNTSVFYRTSLNPPPLPPEKLVFKNRCLKLTNPDERTRRRVLFASFFPPSKIEGIFPSHLEVIQPAHHPEPMVDGSVLFIEPSQWREILEDVDVHENLKWSEDEFERAYIVTFLKQILLMIMAEARAKGIKKIELRYSYPSSFSIKMRNDLSGFWDAVSQMGRISGFEIKVSSPEIESACVCKYLIKDPHSGVDRAKVGAEKWPQIVVDIGGTTTDISIWIKNTLRIQTSLLLGGNIISKYAGQKDKFREKIEEITGKKIEKDLFQNHSSAVMNILLGLYGEEISNSIKTTAKYTPEINCARTIIAFTISGIFYYIGILIRQFASQGKDIDGCNFYLAGNGARLLPWVLNRERGEYDYGLLYSTLRCGADASLDGKDLKIVPPRNYKEEVARGLLYKYDRLREPIKPPVVILGEKGYTYNEGKQLSWNFNIYDDIKRLRTAGVPDEFPEIRKFIEVFNSQADDLSLDKIDLKPKEIKAWVEDSLTKYEEQEKEKVLMEPFFIEEIKAILESLGV